MTRTASHRIVVLGAGYAGLAAAGRLTRRLSPADVEIFVVDASPDFVERVRLHEVAAGSVPRPRPLATVLAGTGARFIWARVTEIDVNRRRVHLDSRRRSDERAQEEVSYDFLVIALGSGGHSNVPGASEYAGWIADATSAHELRGRLATLDPGRRVIVVGGGLTGIELISELAETHPHLELGLVTHDELGHWLSPMARRHLRRAFDRFGIVVHPEAEVTQISTAGVELSDGTELSSDAVVVTTGFAPSRLPSSTPLALTTDGRIQVDRSMRSMSHPEVYAVGDVAHAAGFGGLPLRMSCAAGVPMGWRVADALTADLTGHRAPQRPIPVVDENISLGRRDGVIQLSTTRGRPVRFALSGRPAAWVKELISKGAMLVSVRRWSWPARRVRVPATSRKARQPGGSVLSESPVSVRGGRGWLAGLAQVTRRSL